jgi:hypothetical protein
VDEALIQSAVRLSSDPFFLAYRLAVQRRMYGQTIEEQAASFGLDLDR